MKIIGIVKAAKQHSFDKHQLFSLLVIVACIIVILFATENGFFLTH